VWKTSCQLVFCQLVLTSGLPHAFCLPSRTPSSSQAISRKEVHVRSPYPDSNIGKGDDWIPTGFLARCTPMSSLSATSTPLRVQSLLPITSQVSAHRIPHRPHPRSSSDVLCTEVHVCHLQIRLVSQDQCSLCPLCIPWFCSLLIFRVCFCVTHRGTTLHIFVSISFVCVSDDGCQT
jgi:hypothetical protein